MHGLSGNSVNVTGAAVGRQQECMIAAGWRLTSWECRGSSRSASEDVWIAHPVKNGVRMGVFDGVTSTARTSLFGSISGGRMAALTAASTLLNQSGAKTEAALARAHGAVRDLPSEGARWSRDVPQAAFAVIEATAGIRCWIGADCEVWVRGDGRWDRLAGHDMVQPRARPRLDLLNEDPLRRRDLDAWLSLEAELLDDPAAWSSTSMGRFAELRLTTDEVSRWDEVVVASDGGCISAEALGDLDTHVSTVCSRDERDDLCVLRLARGAFGTTRAAQRGSAAERR